jgi:hypothetical protein
MRRIALLTYMSVALACFAGCHKKCGHLRHACYDCAPCGCDGAGPPGEGIMVAPTASIIDAPGKVIPGPPGASIPGPPARSVSSSPGGSL